MKLRIAMREEGYFWNAYIANTDTMKGALLIGSIAIGAVKSNPDLKARFVDLMQNTFADALTRQMGIPVEKWDIASAPEHERSGRA